VKVYLHNASQAGSQAENQCKLARFKVDSKIEEHRKECMFNRDFY
jgi:hypothetical protein